MKNPKHLLAFAITFLLITMLVGCKKHNKLPGKRPIVGFSMDSLVVERWKRDIEAFSLSVKKLGADLVVKTADQDARKQEKQIKHLMQMGIDVLVVVPNNADQLAEVIGQVRKKGIPVISYDRLLRRARSDLYVSFDNKKVGVLMASAILRAVPSGRYILVNGPRSDNNALMINRGVHKVVDPLVRSGKIKIVAEIWPKQWESAKVKSDLEAIISSDREIDAIIASNDMLAEVAINILLENRLIERVKVVGQDADLAACQRIAEGSQYATIYKPIERLALKAAGFAVMLAKGEPITTDATIDDGVTEVPYVRLEPILVTKEHLGSTVIKDGFHSAENVYQNVASSPLE